MNFTAGVVGLVIGSSLLSGVLLGRNSDTSAVPVQKVKLVEEKFAGNDSGSGTVDQLYRWQRWQRWQRWERRERGYGWERRERGHGWERRERGHGWERR